MPSNPAPANPRKSGVAAAIAAMVVVATPFVAGWEGTRTSPYYDSVGVQTVCVGETRVAMRTYTLAECNAMLRRALEEDFGPAVLAASPKIGENAKEFAAHTSLAYNIGIAGYRNSSVRRLFNEGRGLEACRFMSNYKFAGGRVLAGLVYRRDGQAQRIGERELCLAGAIERMLG